MVFMNIVLMFSFFFNFSIQFHVTGWKIIIKDLVPSLKLHKPIAKLELCIDQNKENVGALLAFISFLKLIILYLR